LAHIGAEELADGVGGGLRRIGGAHEVAPTRHGVVLLEDGDDDRGAGHELHQLTEERALPVDLVEPLGHWAREVGHADRLDPEATFLDARQDGAGLVLLDGIRFHDAEGAFDGHVASLMRIEEGSAALLREIRPLRNDVVLVVGSLSAQPFIIPARVLAMSLGVGATRTPAASRAAIFSAAVPLPPAMMAPVCPMRLPGGAVVPAMNPATGLCILSFTKRAARSSAPPPISPMRMTPCVSGSAWKSSSTSTKSMPLTGSPPMPMQVDCPTPSAVS